jgi:transaldolase
LVFACALENLRAAADLFTPVWETTGTVDGWVSLKVPPELADKTAPTIEAAQRLHARAERPNLFIKVPGTPSGLNVVSTFPDTYYVGKLAAPGTINTMPEKTLLAFADHGEVGELLEPNYAGGEKVIAAAAAEGLDVDALAESLQTHGAESFSADWRTLLAAIAGKVAKLGGVDTIA